MPFDQNHHDSILERLERHSQSRHPELHQRKPRHQPERGLCWQDRILLTLACVLAALFLLRIGTAEAQDDWGLQFQAGNDAWMHVALDTAVHVEVSGLLARVHVVQSFVNDSNDWVEGTYRYPLPEGAAVDRLYVAVGDRILEGEIHERETAQHIYQQASDAGKVTSLVVQERTNQFKTHLANIGPGETVKVMIGFHANIEFRDGAFHLRLPQTFTRPYGNEPQPATGSPAPQAQLTSMDAVARHGFSLQVDLSTGFPLSALESLYHDVTIDSVDNGYQVTLLTDSEPMDRAFELRWMPEFGSLPTSSLSTWSRGGDVFAQLMLIPPTDSALLPQPREVIFIIDTSGSMEGASLDQARQALLEGLDALGQGDRFNLIQFNSVTEPLFASPVAVTSENLAEASAWLSRLKADGGTQMLPALHEALSGPVSRDLLRQVVFVTDGGVGNERALLADIAGRLGTSRLFTVAIGSAPNDWFMRKAAEIGRGHATRIGHQGEVAETMGALWEHIRLPAVSNLCIDWGLEAEYYPEVIPDLYAGQPVWITARLPAEPQQVTLCGELNGQPWVHDAFPNIVSGQETLATLWARRKIEALSDSLIFGADTDEVKAEVTLLALEHQLLTPYTSMVAVDHTPARPGEAMMNRADLPSLLPAGSNQSTGFPATATGWVAQLLLSLLALGISGGLFLKPFFRLPVLPGRRLAPASGS